MNRRNDYSEQNLFQHAYRLLTIMLRQTWKNDNLSPNGNLEAAGHIVIGQILKI